MPRRSQRLTSQSEVTRLRAELDQCRAELFTKTHGEGEASHRVTRQIQGMLLTAADDDDDVLCVCAELTELKAQLDVPGSAGTLTSAADRKLEEGQRVSPPPREMKHTPGVVALSLHL